MNLNTLPEPVRLALLEWARLELQGEQSPPALSVRDVASVVGLAPSTVHAIESRALDKMRKKAERMAL